MGNKQSVVYKNVHTKSRTPSKPPSKASRQKFISCIQRLPFSLTEEQFSKIEKSLKENKFESNMTILEEQANAQGLYVISEGTCKVVANSNILCHLQSGDIFGEISSLYNLPVSCSVVAETDCCVIFLSINFFNKYRRQLKVIPLKEWYIKQKYLDTCGTFEDEEICQRVVQNCLLETSLLNDWSIEALNELFRYLPKPCIEVYPQSSTICLVGEQSASAHLLLKGEVDLVCDGTTIHLSATDSCMLFGEQLLFCDSSLSYSLHAKTCCQIVTISVESLERLLSHHKLEAGHLFTYSKQWIRYIQMRDQHKEHRNVMCVDVLRVILKQVFQNMSWSFLTHVSLNVKFLTVTSEMCFEDGNLIIIVLNGDVTVSTDQENESVTYKTHKVFYGRKSKRLFVRPNSKALLGTLSEAGIEMANTYYPESDVNIFE